jgi:TPR repeat protein
LAKGTRESTAEAVLLYERAAAAGHSDACFNLGNLYFSGSSEGSVPADFVKSLKYFHKAADSGDVSALYWLGHCYVSGEGGVTEVRIETRDGSVIGGGIDCERGVSLLKKAAEGGHTAANYYLATLFRNNMITAVNKQFNLEGADNREEFIRHLQQAYEDGDPDAAYCYSDLYRTGSDGFAVDTKRANDYLIEAVDRGHPEATASLGAMHYSGSMGFERDKRKAFELYNLAAERGCKEAWRNLAAMYAAGDGVPESKETAKHILSIIFPEDRESEKS